MTRRSRRSIAVLAVLAALAGGGYLVATNRPIAVEVAAPERNVAIRVFGLGTVEARIVADIGFEVGGAISELSADHGDRVSKGDVLARLHATEQEARVARAAAGIEAAEANLRKAEANVARAEAVLAQRREDNRRKQELVGSSIVSQQSADEAQRDEDVAAADLVVARSEVEVAASQITDARALFSYEETILGQHVLTAPFDAMVVERRREAGSVVGPGEVIYKLMAPETVWTLAYVDEAQAGRIEEGQAAEVRLRSLPHDVFAAQVERIGIESDRANEERRVWVKCTRCPPRVFLGEQAEVRILVAVLDEALLVPEAAVAGFDGSTGTVWAVRDGRFERVELSFGHRTEDARLEVVGGLPDGARIVTRPAAGISEGRRAIVTSGGSP